MAENGIKMYSTSWCPDCYRAKRFLRDHGIFCEEIDIEPDPSAATLVMRHNAGKRRLPTFVIEGRYYGNPSLSDPGTLLLVS